MEQGSANSIVEKEVRIIDKWIAYIASRSWIRRGIFIVAFLEVIISPLLPELVVAALLSYRKDISWKLVSVISALGSATGAVAMYTIGKFLYVKHTIFFDKLLGSDIGSYSQQLFEHNTFISMFLAAFTPLPDRIFAFLSGMFALSVIAVFAAFFLGRLVRVGIVAYFSYEYGDEAREYILKHTKQATLIVGGLIALYVALKYFDIL